MPSCEIHRMICSMDGDVIDPATAPDRSFASKRCGGPATSSTLNTSPGLRPESTLRSGELRAVISSISHGPGCPPGPVPSPVPVTRGRCGAGLQSPPPPLPPDITKPSGELRIDCYRDPASGSTIPRRACVVYRTMVLCARTKHESTLS